MPVLLNHFNPVEERMDSISGNGSDIFTSDSAFGEIVNNPIVSVFSESE